MASQITASGQIQEFLRIFKRRRWQILLPALFVFVLGTSFAVIVPKKYVVETRIEIKESREPGDYQLKNPSETSTAREIQNAEQHVKHHNRILQIVEEQGRLWPEFVNASPPDRQQVITGIRENIDVDVIEKDRNEGSTFVDITYRDVDAQRAELFLTLLTKRWVEEVHGRDVKILTKEKEILQEQRDQVNREFIEQNNRWLTEARRMGIDPSRGPGTTGEFQDDPEFAMLRELQRDRQLKEREQAAAETELEKHRVRIREVPEQMLQQVTEEVESNEEEIAAFEEEILQMRIAQSRITPSHSKYRQLQSRIELAEQAIDILRAESRSVSVSGEWVENPKWTWHQRQVEASEEKVAVVGAELLKLDEQIEEYERKTKARVEDFALILSLWEARTRAEELLTSTERELNDKRQSLKILTDAYDRPWEIVRDAAHDPKVREPSGVVVSVASLLIGLALGLTIALLAEYGRNSYRTVYDLTNAMGVPVLGAIAVIRTHSETRRANQRRAIVGVSSAVILGGLTWLTWVWHAAPDKLPTEVLRAIDSFRGLLG